MSTSSPLPYRPCVGLVLFNAEGKVFVGERIDTPGAWQMPQGGIDHGEDIESAAFRELQEEVGTTNAKIIEIADETVFYDFPSNIEGKFWSGKFRGQEQTWVALRFLGKDSDIDLASHNPPEFQKWQWVPLTETADLIVPFKRDVYRKVISLFLALATDK
jgi:putative (di)nucleoside polyphosphate hydrolase